MSRAVLPFNKLGCSFFYSRVMFEDESSHTFFYTHTHIYIHTHIHTYIYIYIHTHTYMYIYTYILVKFQKHLKINLPCGAPSQGHHQEVVVKLGFKRVVYVAGSHTHTQARAHMHRKTRL
jgi:hypothetical protein